MTQRSAGPAFGSVVDYLAEQRGGLHVDVPRNIASPFPFSSRLECEVPRVGACAAFQGRQFDPVWIDVVGHGSLGTATQPGKRDWITRGAKSPTPLPPRSSVVIG